MGNSFLVEMDGMNAVISNLDKMSGLLKEKVDNLITQATITTYNESQDACPVLSGDLKASGNLGFGRLSGWVSYGGDTVDYAWYVEEGTSKQAPQPFLYPAFLDAQAQLQNDLDAL